MTYMKAVTLEFPKFDVRLTVKDDQKDGPWVECEMKVGADFAIPVNPKEMIQIWQTVENTVCTLIEERV